MAKTTPLKKYLARHGLTQVKFTKMLGVAAGYSIGQPVVSMWASGKRKPALANRATIERATMGEVKVADWD